MSWQDPEAANEASRYQTPIPSRTLIAQTLAAEGRSMTHGELGVRFELEDPTLLEALSRRLSAMVRDGQLLSEGGYPARYRPIQDSDVMTGRIQTHPKGFGFVLIEGMPDLALDEKEMRQVFQGDVVRVIGSGMDRRGRLAGRIIEVIKRQQQQFIGKVEKIEGYYFIQLGAPNAHQPIAMEPEQIDAAGLKLGDSCKVEIDEWPSREDYANGHIVANYAEKADTQLIIPTTLMDFDLPHVFGADVMAEADTFKEPGARERKGRIDLRELPLVTIDGEDARDFDDAVYAAKRPGGGFRLIVAIADVSHYVRPGSALDTEAQKRGTSVYFPNHVVPMLPEVLSNGLCSLKPQVDRLCMVCDMNLSRAGRVTGYEFYAGVMHSAARLTYSEVSRYLGGDTAAVPDVKPVRTSLNTLYQLFQVLLANRAERGAMEFETTETYMTFDELGGISQILPRTRNDAHRLIEECMLLANVSAADFALKNDLPVLYRNHEAPESTRTQKVRDYLRLIGFDFPEKPTQADYQRIIEATADRIDAESIHTVLLRSMMQAFYGPNNLGHYGLAYEAYTHFTSPIRRYPDLLLHRAIKSHLSSGKQALEGAALEAAGEETSYTERRADEAARSVMSWLKCHYMQQHLGEEFQGVITAVTEFGLFVTLSQLYVDGLIHIRNLGNDFFVFDGPSQSLTGRHHGQKFALGDKVRVKVAGVNLDDRKIDFELLSAAGRGGKPRLNSTGATEAHAEMTAHSPKARNGHRKGRKAPLESTAYKQDAPDSIALLAEAEKRKKSKNQGKNSKPKHEPERDTGDMESQLVEMQTPVASDKTGKKSGEKKSDKSGRKSSKPAEKAIDKASEKAAKAKKSSGKKPKKSNAKHRSDNV